MPTPSHHRFDHLATCDLLAAEVAGFVATVTDQDLSARVPSCPDWDVAELIRHTGVVHRWATALVAARAAERIDRRTLDAGLPEDPAGLPAWLAEGGAALDATLRAADPDDAMWAWGADQHVRFWPRRQLHETLVHRLDAALAVGVPPVADPEVATDAIDEFLENVGGRIASAEGVAGGRGPIGFTATDTGATWHVDVAPAPFAVVRGGGDGPDVVAAGPASELLLVLLRRAPADGSALEVRDAERLATWVDRSKFG